MNTAKSEQILAVETSLGTIIARESPDTKYYPGIWLGIERNGRRMEYLVMDVDEVSDEPSMGIHVWPFGDPWEDPVYSSPRATAEELDKGIGMLPKEVHDAN